jgi:hypothetical protein
MRPLLVILLLLSPVAYAQDVGQPSKGRPPMSEEEAARMGQEWNLPPEMRARLAIERANNEHRKVLEDVDAMSELTEQVSRHYETQGKLSSGEMKGLEKIEKLAKRILLFAGGSEEKDDTLKSLSLKEMIARLNEAVEKVKTTMAKEPRQVISATVIANSNETIILAQQIRRSQKK